MDKLDRLTELTQQREIIDNEISRLKQETKEDVEEKYVGKYFCDGHSWYWHFDGIFTDGKSAHPAGNSLYINGDEISMEINDYAVDELHLKEITKEQFEDAKEKLIDIIREL